jgi:hypothetical protein
MCAVNFPKHLVLPGLAFPPEKNSRPSCAAALG